MAIVPLPARQRVALLVLLGLAMLCPGQEPASLPVRGLHIMAPAKQDLPAFLDFIAGPLAAEGVNTLILQIDYGFDFHSRPEFAAPWALGKDDLRRVAAACRGHGIALIPLLDCLGHQSWAARNGALLTKHPEFDETPGKFPENKDIYCRSWCPLLPAVDTLVFALLDELIDACEAKAAHVGMDEVFILADPDCPRCRGKDPAELFAGQAIRLHDHLAARGCRMWMWGDRLIDGAATGIGRWEGSTNGTHAALARIPGDVVICDWHYEQAHPTPRFFAEHGFAVVACPWRKGEVALGQLDLIRRLREGGGGSAPPLGMVQTVWCGAAPFMEAYRSQAAGGAVAKDDPAQTAQCFRELFKAIRAP
jgi:hypothetical protein